MKLIIEMFREDPKQLFNILGQTVLIMAMCVGVILVSAIFI